MEISNKDNEISGSPNHPVSEWSAIGVSEVDAIVFVQSGVSLAAARSAFARGLNPMDAVEYLQNGASISEAVDLQERGVLPTQVIGDGRGGFTLELDPWQVDPADDLPDVIQPGRIAVTIWSDALGGDPTAYDVSFRWDGGHIAEWYEDISLLNDLSSASSSPVRGLLAWPDGRDVQLTFSWNDLGLIGHGVLIGMAPTDSEPGLAATEPRSWVRLAKAVVEFVLLDLGSRRPEESDWSQEYLKPQTGSYVDLGEVFRDYLNSDQGVDSAPNFKQWVLEALSAGVYELPDDQ